LGAAVTDSDKQSLLHSLDRYGGIFNVNIDEYWAAMAVLVTIFLVVLIVLQKRKDAA
jgi:hypothetical protein